MKFSSLAYSHNDRFWNVVEADRCKLSAKAMRGAYDYGNGIFLFIGSGGRCDAPEAESFLVAPAFDAWPADISERGRTCTAVQIPEAFSHPDRSRRPRRILGTCCENCRKGRH